jgi:hypothetical protein
MAPRTLFSKFSRVLLITFNWIRKSISMVLLVVALGWMVLSHSVQAIADVTTGALRLAGIAAISSTDIRSQLRSEKRLRVAAERQAQSLRSDLNSTRTRLDQSRADLALAEHHLAETRANNRTLQREVIRLESESFVTLRGERVPLREATQETIGSVQKRTATVASANLGSAWGESIPIYGVAVVIAATSFELGMACKDMDDLYELQVAIDPEGAIPAERDQVCGLQVPTRDEIWDGLRTSPIALWERPKSSLDAGLDRAGEAAGRIQNEIDGLEMPDFGGAWQWMVTWFTGLLD